MYVVIGSKTYTEISNLRFEPETDVVGSSVPVNDLEVDILTPDDIAAGQRVSLYDDNDMLWAKYWVMYADRQDMRTVKVKGQSAIKQLERDMLPPAMYDRVLVSDLLPLILARLNGEYTLSSEFSTATVSGYCPEQTARNRLQWICMAIGAYIKNFFNDRLEILPVDEEAEIVPMDKIFWKPEISYGEYVTAVRVFYYDYVERTPSVTEDWIEVDGRYYVQSGHQITLRNSAVPSNALEHVITVENVTIVNSENVDDILSHLAFYYFRRTEASFDLVDDGEYIPGQRITVGSDMGIWFTGYITSCSFTFGTRAKANVKMTAVEEAESAIVEVRYMWGTTRVGRRRFRLPIGYEFELDNPYVDLVHLGHRYVFRPTLAKVSGTVVENGNTIDVPYEVALDFFEGDLYIKSVSELEFDGTTVTIG